MTISYTGTNYFGWQKAKSFPTVQEELEKACNRILQEKVICEAASRTDRGVHAAGQIVQFFTFKSLATNRLQKALNAVLPCDIRILQAKRSDQGFHPSLQARSKTYRYYLCLGAVQTPFDCKFSWHYPYAMDLAQMRSAANRCMGTLNFGAFTTEKQKDNMRSVTDINLLPLPGKRLCIEMTADRFLYKMARTIAGTLANIGSGKLPSDVIELLFSSKNRSLAGVTAPAHGLILHRVHY